MVPPFTSEYPYRRAHPEKGSPEEAVLKFVENCHGGDDDDADVVDTRIRKTLGSYLTGNFNYIPEELHKLMEWTSNYPSSQMQAVWVFYYMHMVLEGIRFGKKGTPELRANCQVLEDVLKGFQDPEPATGNAWESLICVSFLVQLITGNRRMMDYYNCEALLSLNPRKEFDNCRVSFNQFLKEGTDLAQIKSLEELLDNIERPNTSGQWKDPREQREIALYPHVVLYKPSHPQFEVYDFILVAYKSAESERKVLGYHLTEGSSSPTSTGRKKQKANEELCDKSILLCGPESAQEWPDPKKGWRVLSHKEITHFLGVSGTFFATPSLAMDKQQREINEQQQRSEK